MVASHGYLACPECEKACVDANALEQHRRAAHSAAAKQKMAIESVRVPERTRGAPFGRAAHDLNRSRRLSPRLVAFARKFNLVCCWCDEEVALDVHASHPRAPTREHIVPRANGAPRKSPASNLALAHYECNQRRGTMEESAYRRLLRGEAVTAMELWP